MANLRHSAWSYSSNEVVLHRLSEIYAPFDATRGRPYDDTSRSRPHDDATAGRQYNATGSRRYDDVTTNRQYDCTTRGRQYDATGSRHYDEATTGRQYDYATSGGQYGTTGSRNYDEATTERQYGGATESRHYGDATGSRQYDNSTGNRHYDDAVGIQHYDDATRGRPYDRTRVRPAEPRLRVHQEEYPHYGPDLDTITIAPPVPDKDVTIYRAPYTYPAMPAMGAMGNRKLWPLPEEPRLDPRFKPLPRTALSSRLSTMTVHDTMSRTHEVFFVGTICMAQFCTQAGLGQTLAIIHVIGDTWNITNPSDLSWLISGYTLSLGAFILFAGRLGDAYGYKLMFLTGFAWSALWSILAGVAVYSNVVFFTVCRVFHGLGAALCLPNAIALLGATYPPGRRKSLVFASFAAMAPSGSIIGAAGGSAMAQVWWPIPYWVFGFILGGIAIMGFFAIPSVGHRQPTPKTFHDCIMDLDIPGAVTGISALGLLSFSINQAPVSGWNQPVIWLALGMGIVLTCVFITIECHYAKNPIVPLNALSPQVCFILGAVACGWSCFGIWSFYTWQFLQVIRRLSPLLTTAWMSPVIVVGLLAAMTTGMLLHKLGPPVVMTISMAAFATGTVLIATVPEDQTYWGQTFICMTIISWGMDMSFPAATLLLSNSVKQNHQGIAAGLVATVINYSMSLGVGIGGTVEAHVNKGAVTKQAVLAGYRAALFTGVALACLGVVVCLAFMLTTHLPSWVEDWKETARELEELENMKRNFPMQTGGKGQHRHHHSQNNNQLEYCNCHNGLDGTTVGSTTSRGFPRLSV